MKRSIIIALLVIAASAFAAESARAGEMDVLLSKLVEKGILSPNEAQLVAAEAKKEAAKELAMGEAVTAPSWTQKIKMKGDVRFRTQTDWGKDLGGANQRTRQRVRARVGLDGKVNDQISGGVQVATGDTNISNSTNQTLADNFSKKAIWFDQFYVLWKPKVPSEYGNAKVWAGKFNNPLVKTELMWDSDINPEGVLAQYSSPIFFEDSYPTYFYGNGGYFWMDEAGGWEADPLTWVWQGGFNTLLNEEWGTTLDTSIAYYDFANLEGKRIDFRNTNAGNTNFGSTFKNVDLILQLDSKKFMDHEVGWGLYTDYNVNVALPSQKAYLLGAYLGNKRPAKQGEWKGWFEWRYLDIDSILDTLPDSDFYAFNTMGTPFGGGTNCKGINFGVQYAILKDTVLNFEYYYTVPLEVKKSGFYDDSARQLLQMDVNIKF